MAGFLFRRQKEDLNVKRPAAISSPTTLQPSGPTPLYARLATTTQNGSTPRLVSSPMLLGNKQDKKSNGVEARHTYSTSSLTSVDRGRKDSTVQQAHLRAGESSSVHPISQAVLDKPLPPPVPPAEEKPTPIRQNGSNRLGPPSTFPLQQQISKRGWISLDSQSRDNKPLPRPGSAQSFYPASAISPAASTPLRSRSTSIASPSSTNLQAQEYQSRIQKSSSSASTSKSNREESQNMPLVPPSKTRVLPIQESYRDEIASPGSASPPSTQKMWPESDEVQTFQSIVGGPERTVEHPEHHKETFNSPTQPDALNSRQPFLDGKSPEQSSFPNILPPPNDSRIGTPTLSQRPVSVAKPQTPPRRVLPSPPHIPTNQSPPANVVPSSYQDLYPSHLFPSVNRRLSLYDATHQSQPASTKTSAYRKQSITRSSSPPLPPGTAAPVTMQFTQPTFQQLGVDETGNRPQLLLRPPGRQNPNAQSSYHLRDQPPLVLPNLPEVVPLRKSPSTHSSVTSLTRGKPRIFAAMEVQEENRLQVSTPPGPVSLPHLHQQNLVAPAPTSLETKRLVPVVSQMQQNALRYTPTTEEFSTPKADFEPLPEVFSGDEGLRTNSSSIYNVQKPILVPPQSQLHAHSRKPSHSRSTPPVRQEDLQRQLVSPQTTSRMKKLSKAKQVESVHAPQANGSLTNLSPDAKIHRSISKSRLVSLANELEPATQLEEGSTRNVVIPLDDDPFARVEGVKMLKPSSSQGSRNKSRDNVPSFYTRSTMVDGADTSRTQQKENGSPKPKPFAANRPADRKERSQPFLLDPMFVKRDPPEPATMTRLLLDGQVLACLLEFLSFYEWCTMLSLSKEIRSTFVRTPALREAALERFLKTVGYSRWVWDDQDPLSLSLQDLSDYMRGVSIPTHEYARTAATYIHSLRLPTTHRDPSVRATVQRMIASTRAYTRVLLRLRAQAEKETSVQSSAQAQAFTAQGAKVGYLSPSSRTSSRAPSPTASHHSNSNSSHLPIHPSNSQTNLPFRSPLFRLRRAPLLRVFVPSPEGDWLSDKSVLECEAECKRAGVQHLLRMGDVVWDVAVGDEGNVGRLVWDGSYLLDLDYTYSVVGDLPKYIPSLAFPPSYFHRVIRTGHSNSNPIVHIDITAWGQEIAVNLQLLQDRIRTETPQGAYHNVMRYVHRSSFQLRPPKGQQTPDYPPKSQINRIPISNAENLFVDSGWYGTIVVETEGTNEALADLQDRCGPGVFSRPYGNPTQGQLENRKVFRILRERSRPGEVWIRAVGMKERLL